MEDQAGPAQAQTRLRALERGSPEAMGSPPAKGWVRSHVALAEGKVYCEFESPMARQSGKRGEGFSQPSEAPG